MSFPNTASGWEQFANNVCGGEFRDLVRGGLLTGARYGELARLRCKDYDPRNGTIHIAESKSGRPRHVYLTDEGKALFDTLTADKPRDGLVFVNSVKRRKRMADSGAWGEGDETKLMRAACEAAGLPHLGFHQLRHTYASWLVNKGVPLGVVAHQLGHSDTRMVERHYGHLAPSYVADTVRAAFPALGIVDAPKVEPLRIRGKLG